MRYFDPIVILDEYDVVVSVVGEEVEIDSTFGDESEVFYINAKRLYEALKTYYGD